MLFNIILFINPIIATQGKVLKKAKAASDDLVFELFVTHPYREYRLQGTCTRSLYYFVVNRFTFEQK